MIAAKMKAKKTAMKPSHSSAQSPLDQRLLAYALGGGALALAATPADAAVIWSGIQNASVASLGPTADPNNYVSLNLVPSDATSPTFRFSWQAINGGTDGASVSLSTDAIAGDPGSFGFYTSSSSALNNFAAGETVGPANDNPSKYPNYSLSAAAAVYDTNGDWTASLGGRNSNWSAGGSGYVGFSFLDGGSQTHYGWMELVVPATSAANQEATLVQWAWESDANTPIAAASVPEIDPASGGSALALLVGGLALVEQQLGFAAGAAGLRAWRKRK
jgi:hypothetical protein